MHVLGVALIALGTVGLLYEASRIFWQELRSLRYVRRLDQWAEDVQTWQ